MLSFIVFCHCGVLGQMCYLIASFPDLCFSTYFNILLKTSFASVINMFAIFVGGKKKENNKHLEQP